MFYQMVVAAVLLYGSKLWVLPLLGLKVLDIFHVEVACVMTGMRLCRWTSRPWIYTKSKNILTVVYLKPVATYIARYRHSIAKTVKGRVLLEE